MIKVYVAGRYRADNVLEILDKIRRGIRTAVEVLRLGCAVYCPWLDFQLHLGLLPGETQEVEAYQRNSLEWLSMSDVLLVLPEYETSKGTLAEIEYAKELEMPIVYSIKDLKDLQKTLIKRGITL